MMTFGDAIFSLRSGHRICRTGWNGKNMFLFYIFKWGYPHTPQLDLETLPFIAMKTADDKIVPWLASQTDMLAHDWMVVK